MGVILDVPWSTLGSARAGWDDTADRMSAAATRLDALSADGGLAPTVAQALASWRSHWQSYLEARRETCESAAAALAQAQLSFVTADVETAEHARSLLPYAYRDAAIGSETPRPDPADGPSAWPSGEEATPEPAP